MKELAIELNNGTLYFNGMSVIYEGIDTYDEIYSDKATLRPEEITKALEHFTALSKGAE